MAAACFPDTQNLGNTYLVETRQAPVTVANAVVVPKRMENDSRFSYLPLRIINPSPEDVTLHKGMRVARLELIQDPDFIASTTVGADKPVSSVFAEMQELLWTLVEKVERH